MEMQFPVILDGATGTELQKRGFTGDMSAEQWVLEHPESILEIQRKYVASGSNVLYTPTFGGDRQKRPHQPHEASGDEFHEIRHVNSPVTLELNNRWCDRHHALRLHRHTFPSCGRSR